MTAGARWLSSAREGRAIRPRDNERGCSLPWMNAAWYPEELEQEAHHMVGDAQPAGVPGGRRVERLTEGLVTGRAKSVGHERRGGPNSGPAC